MPRFRKPASVKGALLALLLPAGIGLMALAWLIHGLLLERMSREFLEGRLQDEVTFLEHQLRENNGRVDELQTGDYFQEVFHHAFAIQSPNATVISPEAWTPLLEPLIHAEVDGTIRAEGMSLAGTPNNILAHRTTFLIGNRSFVVIVAEDLEALERSQSELHAWTAVISVVLILLLAGTIWLGINLSMRPVVSLQAALKRLQQGEMSRITVQGPEEFRPLVQQLNLLLDSLDQRLARSREALANLSHSVKTPIAALRQILEDTTRPLNDDLRHQMASRLDDIDRQLEAELRRGQFAGPQVGKRGCPVKQARELLWMLGRLYPEKSFELSTKLAEESRWAIEENDLNEIMGNLIDNAGKWAVRYVELMLEQSEQSLCIIVTDDGPGVNENALAALGQRGLRLDEQTPGHGLGLAIVCDIVDRYGGETRFSRAPAGGLRVSITFHRDCRTSA